MNLLINGKNFDLSKPKVMGILNITPDSFYDGGKYHSEERILRQTEKMIAEGAAIIDIGAVSSRPGSTSIPEKEEWEKLKPVIHLLRQHFPEIPLSIDTFRSRIAERSFELGADIINDISGGTLDPEMFNTIARLKMTYVMMHIQGTPENMQQNPHYADVVSEIKIFFSTQLNKLKELGHIDNIILDPGFGFGKTLEHNYRLLKNLNAFCDLGFPVMAGLSRKSVINKVLKTKPEEALSGTIVLNTLALLQGANILRVHDVKEATQAIELVHFYRNT